MARLILDRQTADPSPPSFTSEPLATVLLDADATTLCHVDAVMVSDDGVVALAEVAEPDLLLDYSFGHGGRQIMLPFPEAVVEGGLETCWEATGRRWWIDPVRWTRSTVDLQRGGRKRAQRRTGT
jgi:hypothetical protein